MTTQPRQGTVTTTEYIFTTEMSGEQKDQLAILMQLYYQERSSLPSSSVERYRWILDTNDEDIGLHWHLASNQNKLIGYARLEYRNNPINDLTYATLEMFILPEFRRKHIATSLFQLTITNLPTQIERIQFSLDVTSQLNDLLQSTYQLEFKYQTRLNVSEIHNLPIHQLKSELYQLRKSFKQNFPQFELLEVFNDEYPKSDPQLATLLKIIWNGVPGEDEEREEEDFPVSRVEGRYQWFRDQQADFLGILIRNHVTGEYVGLTELMIYQDNQEVAYQSLTGVHPDNRGHNFGYLMKLEMLCRLLERGEVNYWVTSNAEENPAIVRLNTKLGYKQYKKYNIYIVKVDKARNWIESKPAV